MKYLFIILILISCGKEKDDKLVEKAVTCPPPNQNCVCTGNVIRQCS